MKQPRALNQLRMFLFSLFFFFLWRGGSSTIGSEHYPGSSAPKTVKITVTSTSWRRVALSIKRLLFFERSSLASDERRRNLQATARQDAKWPTRAVYRFVRPRAMNDNQLIKLNFCLGAEWKRATVFCSSKVCRLAEKQQHFYPRRTINVPQLCCSVYKL